MKLLSTILIFTLLIPGISKAQTVVANGQNQTKEITFIGKIVDAETGEAMPYAQINHIYKSNNTDSLIIKNLVSDKNGFFKFQSPRVMNNRIEIIYLGYNIYTRMLSEAGSQMFKKTVGNIVSINRKIPDVYNQFDLGVLKMTPDVKQIDEVVVKARLELFKRVGDTLLVFPRAVKQLEGDALIDLIKRHPSFYVDDSGNIFVDGKPIERAMLNNKNIFGDDVKTMVHSIMAKEAGLIKVYDEVDERSEIVSGEKFARKRKVMNVITFKDFNMFKGGEVYAQAGLYENKDINGDVQSMHNVNAKIGQYATHFRIAADGNTKKTALPQKTKENGAGLSAEVSSPDLLKLIGTKYHFDKNVSEQESRTEQLYFPTSYFESQTSTQSYNSLSDKNLHSFSLNGNYVKKKSISLTGSYSGTVGDVYSQSKSVSNLTKDGEQYSYLQQVRESDSKTDRHSMNLLISKSIKRIGGVELDIRGDLNRKSGNGVRVDTSFSNGVAKRLIFNTTSKTPDYRLYSRLKYAKNLANMQIVYEPSVTYVQRDAFNRVVNEATGQVDSILTQDQKQKEVKISNKLVSAGMFLGKGLIMGHFNYDISKYKLEEQFPNRLQFDKSYHTLNGYIDIVYGKFSLSLRSSDNSFSVQYLSPRLKDSNPMNLSVGNQNLKIGKTYAVSLSTNLNELLRLKVDYNRITNPILQSRRYFESNTLLPEFGNYEALAGAILTMPVNAQSYDRFHIEAVSNSRKGFMLVRGYLDYTYENPETDLLGTIARSNTHRATGRLSLISNFSSSFRLDITNGTSYSHTKINSSDIQNNSWISNNLTAKTSFNLFYRMMVNADYTYSYNYNSRSKYTVNVQTLNASIDYRIFSNRKGVISLNAYNLLNSKSSLVTTSTDLYIQNLYRPENSTLIALAFKYKFGLEE